MENKANNTEFKCLTNLLDVKGGGLEVITYGGWDITDCDAKLASIADYISNRKQWLRLTTGVFSLFLGENKRVFDLGFEFGG